MNDSDDRFAPARPRLSSRLGAAPREVITAHRLRERRTDNSNTRASVRIRADGPAARGAKQD